MSNLDYKGRRKTKLTFEEMKILANLHLYDDSSQACLLANIVLDLLSGPHIQFIREAK